MRLDDVRRDEESPRDVLRDFARDEIALCGDDFGVFVRVLVHDFDIAAIQNPYDVVVDGIDFSLVRLDGFVALVGTCGCRIAVLNQLVIHLILNAVDREFLLQRGCKVFNLLCNLLGEALFIDAAR